MSRKKSLSPVELITQNLRERSRKDGVTPERVAAALSRAGALWESRLADGSAWTPPAGSPYPWAQVKISLAGLIPGLKTGFGVRALGKGRGQAPPLRRLIVVGAGLAPALSPKPALAALILAGNTPLMSWSPLCACLLAGWSVVVKMSRDETLWPRLFVESLAEIDAEVADRIVLHVWPGEDERTAALRRAADAIIAYGSDTTIANLRALTPETTPFFGFGHSISIGICTGDGIPQIGRFARDVLLFEQSGCLSAQAIFVEASPDEMRNAAENLACALTQEAAALDLPPVTDAAVARIVRTARDMALFRGVRVIGDENLRWTILVSAKSEPMDFPIGHCVVQLIPAALGFDRLLDQTGAMRNALSCIGVAGTPNPTLYQIAQAAGVSRICPAGEMQCPPLDWSNGNQDLLQELIRLTGRRNKGTKEEESGQQGNVISNAVQDAR